MNDFNLMSSAASLMMSPPSGRGSNYSLAKSAHVRQESLRRLQCSPPQGGAYSLLAVMDAYAATYPDEAISILSSVQSALIAYREAVKNSNK